MDLLLDERSLPTPDDLADVSGPAFGTGQGVGSGVEGWLLAIDRWAAAAAGPETGRPPPGRARLPA